MHVWVDMYIHVYLKRLYRMPLTGNKSIKGMKIETSRHLRMFVSILISDLGRYYSEGYLVSEWIPNFTHHHHHYYYPPP